MSAGPARAHTHSHPLPGPADPRLGPGPQGVQEDTPGLEGAVTPEMQEGLPHSGDPLQAPGLSEASAAPLPSCQDLPSPPPPAPLALRLQPALRPAAAPPLSHQHRGLHWPAQRCLPTRPHGHQHRHQHPRQHPQHGLRQHPRPVAPSPPWPHEGHHRLSLNPLNGQDPPALEAPVQAPLHHRPFLWTEDPGLGPADVGVMATGTRGSHQGPTRLASLSWALGTKRSSWASAWYSDQLGG